MKVLHKFIVTSYLGPMVLTFFIVLFIFLMQFLWLNIDDLVGKGLPLNAILELLGWVSLISIPMALPLSTLFASLMTMGNLGEHNELLALKSAGISLQRILRPLFVVILFIGIGGFFSSNNLIPYANLKMRSLLHDIRNKRPDLTIPEGMFYNGLPGYSIRVTQKNPITHLLNRVMIYDHTAEKGSMSLTLADSGYIKQTPDLKNLIFTLYNGQTYAEDLDKSGRFKPERNFQRQWFDEQTIVIPLDDSGFSRSNESLFKENAATQNITRLNASHDSLSKLQQNRVNEFDNQYIRTEIFFNSRNELDTVESVKAQIRDFSYNPDSIFHAQTAQKKLSMVDWMATRIESAKMQIELYSHEYEIRRKQITNVRIEWHRKFALSIACIIFFFIGAPLGAIIRKGGLGMPVVISVFFFVIYWVIDITCRKMAQNGAWSPIIGTWFSSIVLAPLGIFLTYKATTDSSLFNPDKYLAVINKVFGRIKKLIIRINLDTVIPSKERAEIDTLHSEIEEINKLCRQYSHNYQLDRLFVWSSKKWTMHDGAECLLTIEQQYNALINNLAAIDDNERLREQLRQYPVLESRQYKLPPINIIIRIAYTIVFPVGTVIYILIFNRRKKLKYILDEILNINNTIETIIKRT